MNTSGISRTKKSESVIWRLSSYLEEKILDQDSTYSGWGVWERTRDGDEWRWENVMREGV